MSLSPSAFRLRDEISWGDKIEWLRTKSDLLTLAGVFVMAAAIGVALDVFFRALFFGFLEPPRTL